MYKYLFIHSMAVPKEQGLPLVHGLPLIRMLVVRPQITYRHMGQFNTGFRTTAYKHIIIYEILGVQKSSEL